ncbi:anhydro-N-acetylmuramic acid kinase [Chungangia koreensis]|uniref:Anhydro-N-acetylmuramic acid kinase n=1 Tax=Chungangia koreensis TaxID=752657 RepID=A0ABV8X2U0_9LACT
MRVCGLMSGTSLDGLDIAVADFFEEKGSIRHELKFFTTMPYPDELRERLTSLMDPKAPMQTISSMNMYLGELFASYVKTALADSPVPFASIDLISSHGQTVWHEPVSDGTPFSRPNTMQIGDISALAEHTRKTVIGDFRPRDIAAGGQGAPLVPFADQYLFQIEENGRVLVNIGGISNITVLPPTGSNEDVIALDTGPGNMIIDAFVAIHTNGNELLDQDGRYASLGKVHNDWLNDLLQHDYYRKSAPKSTGRENFGFDYSKSIWNDADRYGLTPVDKIATVTMLTAKTLSTEIQKFSDSHDVTEVFISGGGVHNPVLLNYLRDLLPGLAIRNTEVLGINSDAKEAFVFALIGYLGFHNEPNNAPAATGANRRTVLGKIAW